jgi:type I restriction enzyme R subunit
MLLNEAETRSKLIDPKIKASGWGESLIEREHFFIKGRPITAGRIYLVGEESRRRPFKRVDYLLRYRGEMIAVIEAKDESHPVDAGLEQAKSYARFLDIPFAFSSNGHGFLEFDFVENKSREMSVFPAPDELWSRWQSYLFPSNQEKAILKAAEASSADYQDPLLFPVCSASKCGKELYYFQEVAVRRVVVRIMRGQKRMLLAMATGTGKTFVAFQIVWKLKKSGLIRKPILFIADRIILRDQAYNTFAPFVDGQSDPRGIIEGGKFNPNRELYFALYQALDAEDGKKPLFKKIPSDFFGLIIIDECHRSGFGKWNNILQHFPDAVQLGMTATPKRSENIDTYTYFCSEEPEIPVDPDDSSKGTWNPPAYIYSLGQGIEDGFLSTYKVHRVRTTVDRDGLRIEEARSQGAEIYVPIEADLKDFYLTPQFEREITLPDRTATMVNHLAGLLRRFGPTEKTMVFCVDMEHARLTSRLLQNAFSDLGYSDFAVPIISEEGEAATWLERFADSGKKTPIVATTAELLSTGVDVPSCKNIVFMKPIASQILFKQIIGRGTRVDSSTNKEWFRIIDYVGASRLFDDWDRPPGEPIIVDTAPRDSILEGIVVHADTDQLIVGASVTVLIGPNEQAGPILTDHDGRFRFENLPARKLRISIRGTGFKPRTVTLETQENSTQSVVIELKPETEKVEKIRVTGLEVTIADEATFMIEATGTQLTLAQYIDYTKENVIKQAENWDHLHTIWTDSEKRENFIHALEEQSIHPEVLSDVLAQPRADQFDLLAQIAFGKRVHTRDERADGFLNRQQQFMRKYGNKAREVILDLLDKYRLAGIQEIDQPEVFRLAPFRDMGKLPGVIERFGSIEKLREAISEMQKRIYDKEMQ